MMRRGQSGDPTSPYYFITRAITGHHHVTQSPITSLAVTPPARRREVGVGVTTTTVTSGVSNFGVRITIAGSGRLMHDDAVLIKGRA